MPPPSTSIPQVCSAIRDLISTGHTPLLSEEQVDNIAKSLATSDERKMLAAYRPPPPPPPAAEDEAGPAAPVPELGPAEQLLLGLMAIPMLEEKLGCVRLVGSFRPRLQAVSEAAETLYCACKVRIPARGRGMQPWKLTVLLFCVFDCRPLHPCGPQRLTH